MLQKSLHLYQPSFEMRKITFLARKNCYEHGDPSYDIKYIIHSSKIRDTHEKLRGCYNNSLKKNWAF